MFIFILTLSHQQKISLARGGFERNEWKKISFFSEDGSEIELKHWCPQP